MTTERHDEDTALLVKELEKSVEALSKAMRSSRNVVRTLGTYLRDGGEIPRDLALAVGGCIMDFTNEDGQCDDKDLQLLLDGCDRCIRL